MTMSIRRRAIGWQSALIVGFALSGALVFDKNRLLWVLPFAWAWTVLVWRLHTFRCPNCDKPIYRRTVRLFGASWTYWSSAFPRRHCSQCGFDLSARVTIPPVSDGKRPEERTRALRASLTGALSVRQLVVILLGCNGINVLT